MAKIDKLTAGDNTDKGKSAAKRLTKTKKVATSDGWILKRKKK